MEQSELRLAIISFVNKESYFDHDEDEDDELTFITRENGDVHAETVGDRDRQEAAILIKKLKLQFPNKLIFNYEEVDEWMYVKVTIL